MFARPRYHKNRDWTLNRGDDILWAARTLAAALEAGDRHYERRQRRQNCQPRCRMPRNGSRRFFGPPRSFRRGPRTCPGRRIITAIRDGWEAVKGEAQEQIRKTGNPGCCRGEAIRWPPATKYPGGTVTTKGKRGGLVGTNPEALSGEAPQGQPMIRGETLEAVCVESPKGQPRNHRRPPKQVRRRPMGEEPERRDKRRDPRSSRCTKAGKSEHGGGSRDVLHGERAASWTAWMGK